MTRRLLWLWLLACPVPLAAQGPALGLSGGATGEAWRVSGSATWSVTVGPLRLGGGPRLTRYGGDPARYRTPDTPPAGLATRIEIEPAVWSLNLYVLGELRLVGPVGAGANIDLAGVAAGPSRRSAGIRLEPARWSLLRYGDNDRGSLNSEFYLRVSPHSRVSFRAGVSHYVTGYRVAGGDRARYLRFDTVPFVAIGWRP